MSQTAHAGAPPSAATAARTRVLFVLSQRDYASNGGIASIFELLKRLERVGRQVWTSHDNEFTARLRHAADAVEVHPFLSGGGGFRRVLNVLRSNIEAFRAVRRDRIAVLHANDRVAFWRTAPGARLAGARIVDNVRDTQPRLRFPRSLKWALEFLLADAVVVLSQDMIRHWDRVLPVSTRKWRAVYSAVDPAAFYARDAAQRAALRKRLELRDGETALLYVGAFRDKKRQLEFLRHCAPLLLRGGGGVRLHFLGDFQPATDSYARACRDAANELGIAGRVAFHGHRRDVADWYAAGDLTLLASAQEGLARSMIESLACGTPVVSFDVASAAEILSGHEVGWVAPMGDYAGVAGAVAGWLAQPQAHAGMRARAAAVAAKLFSPAASAAQYEAVYERR